MHEKFTMLQSVKNTQNDSGFFTDYRPVEVAVDNRLSVWISAIFTSHFRERPPPVIQHKRKQRPKRLRENQFSFADSQELCSKERVFAYSH